MVKQSQVLDGLMAYIEAEILPAVEGWKSWVASAVMVRLYQSAGTLLPELLSNKSIAALGLVDADGMVDIDAMLEMLKETARKKGKLELDIPMLGKFRFGEADFDTLAQHIKNSAA